ncbi:MAG: glycoside hydrolase family 95 protein [Dysgonamonadaceae bacterium]|jgi:alpha-L-fucosidase 2|nr:glycoside hydrolase family 95 protein [Dysgonamonadaceae bacterium]
MYKPLVFLFVIALLFSSCQKEAGWKAAYHFNQPAAMWEETFPLGNGRIGLMPDGGVDTESFVMNEISLWSGSSQDANNPEAKKYLPEIRKLLFEGRSDEAQQLMYKGFICGGKGSGGGGGAKVPYGSYQLLGNLVINYRYDNESDTISSYCRELTLDNATASTVFKKGKVQYNRRSFTSFESDVAVIHLNTGNRGALNFSLGMNRPERAKVAAEGKTLTMKGQLYDGYSGDNGMRYGAKVSVVLPKDGELTTLSDTALSVNNATEAIVLVSMATDYFGKDVDEQLNSTLRAADKKNFATLEKEHIEAYKKLYDRVKVDFGHVPEKEIMPIDERLAAFNKDKNDPSLLALYYQFGRYLLISSTRQGSLPPNLQGLWANTINTPWNGDYHANINVQMNHWIAEQGNLSELHTPLIEWIKSLVPSGEKTAQDFYSSRGWVMHLLGNVWQFTAPGEHPSWGATNTAAAWLCEHLYTHYLYNPDKAYLADVYPVMRGAALFFVDMLVEDPRSHYLVTAPTTSPENAYYLPNGKAVSVCAGSTMDNQIVRELFNNTCSAAEILGVDKEFCDTLKEKCSRLMPTTLGSDGRIMEWLEDFKETEPHHRHISHLYGLHPANEISLDKTPELAEGAKKTLIARGDESTGWSMAWKVNFWARLHDGEHAWKLLTDLLRPCVEKGSNYAKGGGTYPNLFDGHPPFQIDGNFGGAAGIGEMLIQSQNGYVEFLPALPKAWETGFFEGIKIEGGGEASARWEEGKLLSFRLRPSVDRLFKIKMPNNAANIALSVNGLQLTDSFKNGMIEADLKANDELEVTM